MRAEMGSSDSVTAPVQELLVTSTRAWKRLWWIDEMVTNRRCNTPPRSENPSRGVHSR